MKYSILALLITVFGLLGPSVLDATDLASGVTASGVTEGVAVSTDSGDTIIARAHIDMNDYETMASIRIVFEDGKIYEFEDVRVDKYLNPYGRWVFFFHHPNLIHGSMSINRTRPPYSKSVDLRFNDGCGDTIFRGEHKQ